MEENVILQMYKNKVYGAIPDENGRGDLFALVCMDQGYRLCLITGEIPSDKPISEVVEKICTASGFPEKAIPIEPEDAKDSLLAIGLNETVATFALSFAAEIAQY